ncbi:MAG: 1-acyl-sn-glycerol-3-phosphate acyltransferase [Bacteroidota bacterium]
MTEKKKFIDIKKIFHDKNPKLAGFLPRFALQYIRHVIHEDEVNEFIESHTDQSEFDWLRSGLNEFKIKIISNSEEQIPLHGGFIIACNHPLGGWDALALLEVVSHRRKDIKFIVNDILLQLKNLAGLFIGVNKHGKNAQISLAAIDELYSSEHGVLIFPAGLVSRKQNSVIKDLEWKKSFITKSKKHKRNVIPVHIEGENTNRFYNLANWRKRLGIKANIEMFFLVDEMFKQKNKTITITFGKPIPYSVFDKSKTDYEWAQWVKEKVYNLTAEIK